MMSSAEVVEIEIDGEGIALRGNHVNDGGTRGKVFRGEIELESGADESAAAFITEEIGLAGRREGLELVVFAGNLNVEIFPEIIGTRNKPSWRTGAGTGGASDKRAIRIREMDLHTDSYEFALVAMIKSSLLSAVTGGVLAGLLDHKSERSEEGDGIDVRAGLRRRKEFCIFVEESSHGLVAALAEEIGFADSLVGEGRVEGERVGHEKQCSEEREAGPEP